MLTYRVYVLDSAGQVTAVRQYSAASDQDALTMAQSRWPFAHVWQGVRVIGFVRSGCILPHAPEAGE